MKKKQTFFNFWECSFKPKQADNKMARLIKIIIIYPTDCLTIFKNSLFTQLLSKILHDPRRSVVGLS